jgi:hypothetical protein
MSYTAALRRRFHTTGADYVSRARCLDCRHAQEVSVPVIDQHRGLIHLPMVQCERGRWQHPISVAAFVRRRIPAQPHADLVFCGRFEPATGPLPAVEEHRRPINRLTQRRRTQGEPEGAS